MSQHNINHQFNPQNMLNQTQKQLNSINYSVIHSIQQKTEMIDQKDQASIKYQDQRRLFFIEKHIEDLKKFDFKNNISLSPQFSNYRKKVFQWLYKQGTVQLNVQSTTLELAFRAFDKYMADNHVQYKCLWEVQFDLITCFFLACKFHEIYPPSLNDILRISNEAFKKEAILKNQKKIFVGIGMNLIISLPSQWYGLLYQKKQMPYWAYYFIFDLQSDVTAQFIAKAVKQIQENLLQNKIISEAQIYSFIQKQILLMKKKQLKKSKVEMRKKKK